MKVINIYAVPRSGSSLAQNLIATNLENFKAFPENWHAVRLFSALEFESYNCVGLNAAKSYSHAIPKQQQIYERKFLEIYDELLEQTAAGYDLVEKTTRNIYVEKWVSRSQHPSFGIVIVRHPFDVILSHLHYFSNGKRYYFRTWMDLTYGFDQAMLLSKKYHTIIYEDLTNNLDQNISKIASMVGCKKKHSYAIFDKLPSLNTDAANVDETFKKLDRLVSVSEYKFEREYISACDYLMMLFLTRKSTGAGKILAEFYDVKNARRKLLTRIRFIGFFHIIHLLLSYLAVLLNIKPLVDRGRKRDRFWMLR